MSYWARRQCIGGLLWAGLLGSAQAVYVDANPLSLTDPTGLAPPGAWETIFRMSSGGRTPAKPPEPKDFNTDPCVQEYLRSKYGEMMADFWVPNFSGLSYVPGSGMAGQAWTSAGMSMVAKGGLVAVPAAGALTVDAMGVAGAGVAGGNTSSSLMRAGRMAGSFATRSSQAMVLAGTGAFTFSTTANADALLYCTCRK